MNYGIKYISTFKQDSIICRPSINKDIFRVIYYTIELGVILFEVWYKKKIMCWIPYIFDMVHMHFQQRNHELLCWFEYSFVIVIDTLESLLYRFIWKNIDISIT